MVLAKPSSATDQDYERVQGVVGHEYSNPKPKPTPTPNPNPNQVRHIFRQIVCGVAFCHSLGVAHRDLKPENILIQRVKDAPVVIKVADFGLSTLTQARGAAMGRTSGQD